jgi:hypothetical protein
VNLGDTLFSAHLWVVCSEPDQDGYAVVFNLTTRRVNSDTNCVIHPGEHPFVKRESVVAYERGQLMNIQAWVKAQKFGAKTYPPVSDDLLLRIQHRCSQVRPNPAKAPNDHLAINQTIALKRGCLLGGAPAGAPSGQSLRRENYASRFSSQKSTSAVDRVGHCGASAVRRQSGR